MVSNSWAEPMQYIMRQASSVLMITSGSELNWKTTKQKWKRMG